MKLAETVTFGGSGLDRGAEHRRDVGHTVALWQGGRVLLMWRGRPLMQGGALAWLPAAHGLAGEVGTALFLGMDAKQGVFAQDISAWVPDDPVAQQAGFFDASVQAHPDLDQGMAFHELRAVMAEVTPRDAELAATARALLEWHRTHGYCAVCGAK